MSCSGPTICIINTNKKKPGELFAKLFIIYNMNCICIVLLGSNYRSANIPSNGQVTRLATY